MPRADSVKHLAHRRHFAALLSCFVQKSRLPGDVTSFCLGYEHSLPAAKVVLRTVTRGQLEHLLCAYLRLILEMSASVLGMAADRMQVGRARTSAERKRPEAEKEKVLLLAAGAKHACSA